jgi:hypothetical protein
MVDQPSPQLGCLVRVQHVQQSRAPQLVGAEQALLGAADQRYGVGQRLEVDVAADHPSHQVTVGEAQVGQREDRPALRPGQPPEHLLLREAEGHVRCHGEGQPDQGRPPP